MNKHFAVCTTTKNESFISNPVRHLLITYSFVQNLHPSEKKEYLNNRNNRFEIESNTQHYAYLASFFSVVFVLPFHFYFPIYIFLPAVNLAGLNGLRSTMLASPSTTSSATAAPVAGPFRMPQQLCPVAT